MIRLLRLLRDHPDAVEADLSRYHQIDLRGLWRRPRRLTYRQINARIWWLPPDSAVATVLRGGRPLWTDELELLDLNRMQLAALRGVPVDDITPHPHSPHFEAPKAKTDGARERAMERKAERERALNAGN